MIKAIKVRLYPTKRQE
ncbi:helix-turn-helix domain-containing protein, partial [Clostridioides difficile]